MSTRDSAIRDDACTIAGLWRQTKMVSRVLRKRRGLPYFDTPGYFDPLGSHVLAVSQKRVFKSINLPPYSLWWNSNWHPGAQKGKSPGASLLGDHHEQMSLSGGKGAHTIYVLAQGGLIVACSALVRA